MQAAQAEAVEEPITTTLLAGLVVLAAETQKTAWMVMTDLGRALEHACEVLETEGTEETEEEITQELEALGEKP